MSCKHTIGTAVDEDGCCISCGEDLNSIAMAEARKKPEPTEFTKAYRDDLKQFLDDHVGKYLIVDGGRAACDLIEGLTAELGKQPDPAFLDVWIKRASKAEADLKAKNKRIKGLQEFIRKNSGHRLSCGRIHGYNYACVCGFDEALKESDNG